MKLYVTLAFIIITFVSFTQFKFSKPLIVDFHDDSAFFSQNKLDYDKILQYTLIEVNIQRKINNLNPVKLSSDIERIEHCNQWNEKLLDTMYLIHDYDYLNNSYTNNCVGEICIGLYYTKSDYNINIYEYISKNVVQRWIDSPEHRKIMLKSNAKDVVVSFDFKEPSSKKPSIVGISTMRFFE